MLVVIAGGSSGGPHLLSLRLALVHGLLGDDLHSLTERLLLDPASTFNCRSAERLWLRWPPGLFDLPVEVGNGVGGLDRLQVAILRRVTQSYVDELSLADLPGLRGGEYC